MATGKRANRRLEIGDRKQLAEEIQLLIDQAGTPADAFAEAHGMSQSLMSFLLNEKRARVSVSTYHVLMRMAWGQRAYRIRSLFLDGHAQDAVVTYQRWEYEARRVRITVPKKELTRIIAEVDPARTAFAYLIQVVRQRRHSRTRAVVAVQSALLPLERTHITAGIERSWSELTDELSTLERVVKKDGKFQNSLGPTMPRGLGSSRSIQP